MFCPKCGVQISGDTTLCSNCGCDISDVQSSAFSTKNVISNEAQLLGDKPKKPLIRTVLFILAALVLVLSLYSAHCVVTGGLNIASIQSVGGKTLEEAYYQYLGIVYAGYASMIRTTGLFFSAILAYIGIKK